MNLICLTESMDTESEAGDCELNMFDTELMDTESEADDCELNMFDRVDGH